MSSTDLSRITHWHQSRSIKVASVLRVGVVVLMLGAMLSGTIRREWPQQSVLLACYAFATLAAVVLAFSSIGAVVGPRGQFVFAIIDVAMVSGFQLLSSGGYVPLLVMGLLPVLVALEVSWRRAAAVVSLGLVAFIVALLADPVMQLDLGWPAATFLIAMYAFLCATAVLLVSVLERHVDQLASLTASREELLVDTMTASEVHQRRVSESIHDGPLQNVLAALQEITDMAKTTSSDHIDRALANLGDAAQRLREATFELHPAVLEHVGLSAAVEKLASFTTNRSGITVTTDIAYPTRNSIDPIVYGAVRELLTNVVRHSGATHAWLGLNIANRTCHLDVVDNGTGISVDAAARRLAQGHIGLASHRARIEAAGGTLTILDGPPGAHISVDLPLRE
jgi:two-component system NarL family sensor kinase